MNQQQADAIRALTGADIPGSRKRRHENDGHEARQTRRRIDRGNSIEQAKAEVDRAVSDGVVELSYTINRLSKGRGDLVPGIITYSAEQFLSRTSEENLPLHDKRSAAYASLCNQWSKTGVAAEGREACGRVARAVSVTNRRVLRDVEPRDVALLVGSFSKFADDRVTKEAAARFAKEVADRAGTRDGLAHFEPQALSNLANGFSKWPEGGRCTAAAEAVAREVVDRAGTRDGLARFKPQELANLANVFSRWPEGGRCTEGVIAAARHVGAGGRRYTDFDPISLSQFANALSRTATVMEGEPDAQALLLDRLHELADHLDYRPDRLAGADALAVATILKAFSTARLPDDLGVLAPQGLARIEALGGETRFKGEDLETLGNLSVALLPLARSPGLRRHRRQALTVLNGLQPVVARKIDLFLTRSSERGPTEADDIAMSKPDEGYATRCPALSIYQTLKTYSVVQRLWKRPYIEGDRQELRGRQAELDVWLKATLNRARGLIERDLSAMSWNLIAQLEAETPVDALDSFMAANADRITAQHPAAEFDVRQALAEMRHDPRPPEGEAGLMQVPLVDMQGRPVASSSEPERRYSILARLTQGQLSLRSVQLPGELSAFMLARTLNVDGVPYRMDLFGGSRMKGEPLTLEKIFAEDPKTSRRDRTTQKPGKLLALPYAETAPGTAFEQLARKLLPYKESFYYFQRMMMPSPPGIGGLGPHDHVLEGSFRLGVLPDRKVGEAHPFQLTGPNDQPLALRPHDGCGFIKASIARRMPVLGRVDASEDHDRLKAYGEDKTASLPAQALQHYPRDEAVALEAADRLQAQLAAEQETLVTGEILFRSVTAGRIQGPSAVAVPSADGKLHLPALKSGTVEPGGGVLIGRSPYDKPNLRPFPADRVAAMADTTAAFLDGCAAMQYSFVAAEDEAAGAADEAPMFFAKGNLIVVPDEMWPADFRDRDLVMSAEDVKTHSAWTDRKARATNDTPVGCTGILQATEIFAPGSLVAIPVDEQKKLDGDFDGDAVIIIADRPALFAHVQRSDEAEQAKGLPSFKPPKSHTPAIDPGTGSYQFGRAGQILSTKMGVLESYTGLQRSFLAQAPARQKEIAERAILGTYEGLDPELKRGLRAQLEREDVDDQAIRDLLAAAELDLQTARQPASEQVARLLVEEIRRWREGAPTGSGDNGSGEEMAELFPKLAEGYLAADNARSRIEAILDGYPDRMEPAPEGYDPTDPVQTVKNLLSIGIKIGTDAYKSDTATFAFSRKASRLQTLLSEGGPVPYGKGAARQLNAATFEARTAQEALRDNPTLAAGIMEASLSTVDAVDLIPKSARSHHEPPSAERGPVVTEADAPRIAHEIRQRAEQAEPAITEAVREIADSLGATLPHIEKRLRSEASLMTQMQLALRQIGHINETEQPIPTRHVLVFPADTFVEDYKKAICDLEDKGHARISVTNWFKRRDPTYVGINAVMATREGDRYALQFHTPDSYQAKLDNHDRFKDFQAESLRDNPDGSKLRTYEEAMRLTSSQTPRPTGSQHVRDWSLQSETPSATLNRPGFARGSTS